MTELFKIGESSLGFKMSINEEVAQWLGTLILVLNGHELNSCAAETCTNQDSGSSAACLCSSADGDSSCPK